MLERYVGNAGGVLESEGKICLNWHGWCERGEQGISLELALRKDVRKFLEGIERL